MKPVKIYKPGEKLYIREEIPGHSAKKEKVTVVQQYPHFVMVQNQHGIRSSITNAELYGRIFRAFVKKNGTRMYLNGETRPVKVSEDARKFPALNFGGKNK